MKRLAPAFAFALAAAGALSGCAVGPNYRRPVLPEPESFYGSSRPASDASLADTQWWEVFADPVLRSLIEEALRNGYDVRLAAARVEESRARYGIAGSFYTPDLGYSAGVGRSHTSAYATPSDATGNLVTANASVSWEIDVWGRVRRLNEAARAEYLATEEGRRAVVLSLVADVASAYFDLRDLDAELEISRRTRSTFQDTYDLFSRRLAGGAASALETARAEVLLANASAGIPVLEQRIVARENQITLLLGRPPGPVPRGAALTEQAMPPVVPAGLPSALLLRRPDVRAAEQSLVAANADVGVARAAFYPTLSLTGLFGGQSTGLSDLFAAGRTWSIGANLLGPLFQGGRLRAEERVARAQFEQALVSYERAFTRALGEVSSNLVAIEKLAAEETERERSVHATREAVRLATLRYESGLSAYFEVLDALQLLLPAETALVQTRRDRLTAFVSFYRALGGGWSDAPPPPPPAAPGGA
ncbi:MAG: efflux transporter outer membrane subunit [Thermoanaerobaculia bacterium]